MLHSEGALLFLPLFGRLSDFDAGTNCFSHLHKHIFLAIEDNRAGFYPTVPLCDGI